MSEIDVMREMGNIRNRESENQNEQIARCRGIQEGMDIMLSQLMAFSRDRAKIITIPYNATVEDVIKRLFPEAEIMKDIQEDQADIEILDGCEMRCELSWLRSKYIKRGE